jgi:outer membrane biosynthesis protein TonB
VINTLGKKIYHMDAREELKRWIATVVQLSAEEESKVIKQDIDLFLSVAGELSGKLADRNVALAKQIRPRSSAKPAKPPKPAPQKAQKQPEPKPSSDDTPAPQNAVQDRPQERSGQSSQKRQAQPSQTDQQRALRGYVYGAQNDEVQFQKAAKAIAR